MDRYRKVVIIGGGASGIMAAITAAREGCDVIILEHKDRVGKKILMTGNGKCNLTNTSDINGKYYGNDVDRIYKIINSYPSEQTIVFFKEIGLYTKEKRDGGIYPVSEQASSVLDALRTECRHLG
ncbi:MAG: NAD(P)/FAD-dependent oxidoreductase, partial [Coprococcus sp.]